MTDSNVESSQSPFMSILHQSAKINFANNIICPEYMQVYYIKLVEILKKTKHNFEPTIKINFLFVYFV